MYKGLMQTKALSPRLMQLSLALLSHLYNITCKVLQQSTLTCLLLGWPEQCLCPVATGYIPADNRGSCCAGGWQ